MQGLDHFQILNFWRTIFWWGPFFQVTKSRIFCANSLASATSFGNGRWPQICGECILRTVPCIHMHHLYIESNRYIKSHVSCKNVPDMYILKKWLRLHLLSFRPSLWFRTTWATERWKTRTSDEIETLARHTYVYVILCLYVSYRMLYLLTYHIRSHFIVLYFIIFMGYIYIIYIYMCVCVYICICILQSSTCTY